MNVLQASSAVLKTSARFALWGVGLYVGLRIASAAAKPVAGEVGKGVKAFRNKFKKGETETVEEEFAGEEASDDAAQSADPDQPFKIVVEDVASSVTLGESFQETEQAKPDSASETQPVEGAASTSANLQNEIPSMKWLKADLLNEARRLGFTVKESMTKKELLAAIKSRS